MTTSTFSGVGPSMEMETQQSYVGLMDQLVMYAAVALPDSDNTLTDLKEEVVSAHTT